MGSSMGGKGTKKSSGSGAHTSSTGHNQGNGGGEQKIVTNIITNNNINNFIINNPKIELQQQQHQGHQYKKVHTGGAQAQYSNVPPHQQMHGGNTGFLDGFGYMKGAQDPVVTMNRRKQDQSDSFRNKGLSPKTGSKDPKITKGFKSSQHQMGPHSSMQSQSVNFNYQGGQKTSGSQGGSGGLSGYSISSKLPSQKLMVNQQQHS